ncbi:PadR family transcriptional regulator [Streptomyces sp. WAC 06738]|uniref:PadR family transcriptional regulator n=1 Tax=Streptomyces sp. WAC 06738 TaxID=2203210 RepID=UPI000F70B8DB|nr:helix-turn-helix transcriptional regulator [Streptomyces sp. WAC 06738]AZM50737.1 PadR family transcriptional regulator [Streptomyces sp. WAC 06738]
MSPPRLTKPTISVLEVLLDASTDDPPWGLRICRDADLGSGTVYPILARLQERGWVTARDESAPHPGRPPRLFYELTNTGRANARAALEARKARQRRILRLAGGSAK